MRFILTRTTPVLSILTAFVVASLALFGAPSQATSPAPAGPREAVPLAASAAAPAAATNDFARRHGFPTPRTAGVPRGWSPKRTVVGRDVYIKRRGAVVQDLRLINGTLVIDADNVTVRHVEIQGGSIKNWVGSDCHSGLKVRRSTLMRSPGQVTTGDEPTLESGGYTARRVEILGLSEGFRVGGKEECGPVKIVNSYARIKSPDSCGDWHGDGLQGYDGGRLVLKNSVLKLLERPDCGGTAPFFYPEGQGNTSVSIDGLIVEGGGYAFRLGMPGDVRGLHIVQGSWGYGPLDVRCGLVGAWSADIVTLKGGQPRAVRGQRCNT